MKSLPKGYGNGNGNGYGNGYGNGDGNGYGDGYGNGYGHYPYSLIVTSVLDMLEKALYEEPI